MPEVPISIISMGSFEDLPTETRILVLQHLSSIDLRSFLTSQARHKADALFSLFLAVLFLKP